MNFMKNSLFQRNLEQEREEEMPEEGGVLAVWGSPSSGKTVVSVKLAEHLAKKKRNGWTILLFPRPENTLKKASLPLDLCCRRFRPA